MKFIVLSGDTPKLEKLKEFCRAAYENRKNQSDPYVRLARESLTTYLDDEEKIENIPDYAQCN